MKPLKFNTFNYFFWGESIKRNPMGVNKKTAAKNLTAVYI